MDRMPEEIVKLAESVEVKQKTTKPQEVASTVHKGSYPHLWEVFGKLAQGIDENGYEIVSSSIIVCYNDPHVTSEEELVRECPFPVRKRLIGGCFGEKGYSSRGRYRRSTSDIPLKWKDILTKYCGYTDVICHRGLRVQGNMKLLGGVNS